MLLNERLLFPARELVPRCLVFLPRPWRQIYKHPSVHRVLTQECSPDIVENTLGDSAGLQLRDLTWVLAGPLPGLKMLENHLWRWTLGFYLLHGQEREGSGTETQNCPWGEIRRYVRGCRKY